MSIAQLILKQKIYKRVYEEKYIYTIQDGRGKMC